MENNEYVESNVDETTVDDFYAENEEASSIVPKLVGIGAGIIGIGAGVAWKKRDKIKNFFASKKEARQQREAQKHLEALNKLGWKPEQTETETETEE